MSDITISAELAAALVDAQGKASWVGKDATNQFHRYQYASAESVIAEGRAALNSSGLALDSSEWRFEEAPASHEERGEDGKRQPQPIGRVVVHYLLVHKSGACKSWESSMAVIPEKGRPADKAECAALTANLAYTLRGLLQIPRGDDPGTGVDERDDTGAGGRPPQAEERRPTPRREPPADDVPFDVPGERPSASRSPAPQRIPNRDESMVKEVLGGIATADAFIPICKVVEGAETLPLAPSSLVAIKKAAGLRMFAVAATMPELAAAAAQVKALLPVEEHEDWHKGTAGEAYKARRATLTAKPAEGASK